MFWRQYDKINVAAQLVIEHLLETRSSPKDATRPLKSQNVLYQEHNK